MCYSIDTNSYYQGFISLIIVVNTIILGLDTYPVNHKLENFANIMNMIFFYVFLLEMVIKMLGIGLKNYFADGFCVFDFIVIIFSLLEIIIDFINFSRIRGLSAIRVLKVFRLLRVFKLAKIWRSFHELLNIFFFTLSKIAFLSMIVLLTIVAYAILAKEIYSYKLSFDVNENPIQNDYNFEKGMMMKGHSPDYNFDTFIDSFISVFIVLSAQGWSSIYYNVFRAEVIHPVVTILFFYSLYIFARMVLY